MQLAQQYSESKGGIQKALADYGINASVINDRVLPLLNNGVVSSIINSRYPGKLEQLKALSKELANGNATNVATTNGTPTTGTSQNTLNKWGNFPKLK